MQREIGRHGRVLESVQESKRKTSATEGETNEGLKEVRHLAPGLSTVDSAKLCVSTSKRVTKRVRTQTPKRSRDAFVTNHRLTQLCLWHENTFACIASGSLDEKEGAQSSRPRIHDEVLEG